MKRQLLWRFRKGSESNPVIVLDCGCKQWVYDKCIVRFCETHKTTEKLDREMPDEPYQPDNTTG